MIRKILLYALYLFVLIALAFGVIYAFTHNGNKKDAAIKKAQVTSQQARDKAKREAAKRSQTADTPGDRSSTLPAGEDTSAAPTTNVAADEARTAAGTSGAAASAANGELTNTGPGSVAVVAIVAMVAGSALAYTKQLKRLR